jgi:hypothetical protein
LPATSSRRLCVVHLVRATNGVAPLARFVRSYVGQEGGAPHRLLLLMKGFRPSHALAEWDAVVEDVPHDRLHVDDAGLDVGAYVLAARRTDFDLYCFLNSYSEILDPEWLAKLLSHVRGDGADLLGASGSWISHRTNATEDLEFGHRAALAGRTFRLPGPLGRVARRRALAYFEREYDPFPNYHLRTNCFVASRALMVDWDPRALGSKKRAYEFESGRKGLSARYRESGRPLRVVGRNGRSYAEPEWAESDTFWQRGQENLLVGDNQTARYAAADEAERARLARIAWGERADPSSRGRA